MRYEIRKREYGGHQGKWYLYDHREGKASCWSSNSFKEICDESYKRNIAQQMRDEANTLPFLKRNKPSMLWHRMKCFYQQYDEVILGALVMFGIVLYASLSLFLPDPFGSPGDHLFGF